MCVYMYIYASYLSKMRQALVPPKPNEFDMTRLTGPSLRDVRIFMPSASGTSCLMFA